jgi:hypothetical protein
VNDISTEEYNIINYEVLIVVQIHNCVGLLTSENQLNTTGLMKK